MSPVRTLALALRFILELCALTALGAWGWRTGQDFPLRLGLATGAPLIAALTWGLLVSPKAAIKAPGAVRLGIEVAIFSCSVLGLVIIGHSRLGWTLGVAYVIHRAMLFVTNRQ